MLAHLLFVTFVAISVYAQNLTGFALALILLGLTAMFDLVPLPDAANAVTVLGIVNAAMFFLRRRRARVDPAIVPAVVANLAGTLVGMALLTYLAAHAYQVLRMVLGATIVLCAFMLWRAGAPLARTSGPGYFAAVGSLSGVLGGMFSTPGPPLVYAVYRQPWPLETIQESLIFSFAVGGILRLVVLAGTGQFSAQAVLLAIEAIPVVLVVTALTATRPPPFSPAAVKRLVCLFLGGSGLGMVMSTLGAFLDGAQP